MSLFFKSVLIFLFASLAVLGQLFSAAASQRESVLESDCFDSILHKRFSSYSFDSSPLPLALMEELAEAASLTPSSYNDQPWRFIFCDKYSTPLAYERALEALVPANQKWAKEAPLLIIVCANTLSEYTKKLNVLAEYDTGAAVMTLIYKATSLNLLTHEMGGFMADKIVESFAVPKQFKPLVVLALGLDTKGTLQASPKKRLPIDKLFFLGEWGRGLQISKERLNHYSRISPKFDI